MRRRWRRRDGAFSCRCVRSDFFFFFYLNKNRSGLNVSVSSQYLLKVNEIKVKKGVDFLQNLIKYFHAQCKYVSSELLHFHQLPFLLTSNTLSFVSFFQDGLKAVENLKPSVEKLAADLTTVSSQSFTWIRTILSVKTKVTLTVFVFRMITKGLKPVNPVCFQIKQGQDGERKQLMQLRDVLKASLQAENKEVRL